MAPITNQAETLISPQLNAGVASAAGAKPQPAAAEIPVTVNGARTVAGTEKREPFSENTQTVLVFANGAVIRLASPVAPGQLLFLTNEKTKKEVVCQVMKSKTYASASGYVELEFTEASPGFWGMRFPSNGTAASPSNAAKPAAAANPVLSMKLVAEKGETRATTSPGPLANTISAVATEPAANRAAQPAKQVPAISAVKPAESKPGPVAHLEPLAPAQKVPTLAEFLIHSESGAEPTLSGKLQPVVAAAKLEVAKSAREAEKKESPASLPVSPAIQQNPAPGSCSFDFGADEVKIPAWLEPLARNSSIASTSAEIKAPAAHELDVKSFEAIATIAEPAKPSACTSDSNEQELQSVSPQPVAEGAEEAVSLLPGDGHAPNFGSSLTLDEKSGEIESDSPGSGIGLKLGWLAAAALLVAGGAWFWYSNQPKDVAASGRATPANQVAAAATTAESAELAKTKSASLTAALGLETSHNPVNSPNLRAESKPTENTAAAFHKPPVNESPSLSPLHSIEEPAKKSSIGKVHLAAPLVNRHARSDSASDLAPALNSEGVTGSDATAENLLSNNAKQPSAPAAPMQVGGDVKTAALLSSVAPTYPQMARNQRVSGAVRIDALVDANGRISAMKVISGPALLHQSAMDAVRQWKYKAATLNGQPVAMHLTVTVQFRLE
jgi:TonB family protein